MKAIRVHQPGGPDVMKLEEVPDPKPGAKQVLVRLKAVGVNPVDTYIREGKYAITAGLPYTPGSDGAGVVEAIGDGVTSFKPGDRVYIGGTATGAYAELALCNEPQVHRLPERVTFQQGAGVNVPYATAYRGLFHRAQARPGETVLVHGASGGVGTAAVQLARAAGLTVFGTASTDRGKKLVLEQGAHHVLDHTEADYLKKGMDLTAGHGFDVIIELLANVNLAKDLGVVAKYGRIVVIGNRGTIEINPRDAMGKEASILGMTLFAASPEDLVSIHAALIAGLENGTLRPIVGKEFPLTQAAAAHEAVMAKGAYGKIVLIP
jgi:NADPH2:quinone reductase